VCVRDAQKCTVKGPCFFLLLPPANGLAWNVLVPAGRFATGTSL
jgi:hypothetical protein